MPSLTAIALLVALESPAPPATPPATAASVITVPAGTKVPLRLASPLHSGTARTGDPVRAEAAFPVAVGETVAIPPSTYFEGVIDRMTRRGAHAGFTIHFVRMVYSNGYTVALPAATADTRAALAELGGTPPGAMGFQTGSPLPLPATKKPNMGVIVGIGGGVLGAGTLTAILLGRRGSGLTLDAGWQFEMALVQPLSLDAEKVAAAVAIPAPH